MIHPPEKTLKKCLTLKEESVIYATSRQQAERRVAPLFNNLSDICVGTRRIDISVSGRKNIKSLLSEHVIHYEV